MNFTSGCIRRSTPMRVQHAPPNPENGHFRIRTYVVVFACASSAGQLSLRRRQPALWPSVGNAKRSSFVSYCKPGTLKATRTNALELNELWNGPQTRKQDWSLRQTQLQSGNTCPKNAITGKHDFSLSVVRKFDAIKKPSPSDGGPSGMRILGIKWKRFKQTSPLHRLSLLA